MAKTEIPTQFEGFEPQVERLSQLKVGDKVSDKYYEVQIINTKIEPSDPDIVGSVPTVTGRVSRSEKFPFNVGVIVGVSSSSEDPNKFIFHFPGRSKLEL